jgi:hypothetical protein
MDVRSNYAANEFKNCAGKGCQKVGKIVLKIKYLGKTGYFCDSCTDDLLQQDLATKDCGVPES